MRPKLFASFTRCLQRIASLPHNCVSISRTLYLYCVANAKMQPSTVVVGANKSRSVRIYQYRRIAAQIGADLDVARRGLEWIGVCI